MRPFDVLAIVAIVVGAVIGRVADWGEAPSDGPHVRRPDPGRYEAPPHDLPALPPTSAADPTIRIDVPEVHSGSGTAFSVDRSGRWITARHVVDGCPQVVIGTGGRRGVLVERVVNHPNADLSVLWTRGGAPALPVSRAGLRFGQESFQFGFPKGQPGDIYAELIGRRQLRISGRYRTTEPVIAWIQRLRVPDFGPDLGGISGGPVLDRDGSVIGVVVAGAPRRGRSYSTAPVSVIEVLERAGVAAADTGPRAAAPLDGRMFSRYGDGLREKLTVAKVYCLVDERRTPRRRPGI